MKTKHTFVPIDFQWPTVDPLFSQVKDHNAPIACFPVLNLWDVPVNEATQNLFLSTKDREPSNISLDYMVNIWKEIFLLRNGDSPYNHPRVKGLRRDIEDITLDFQQDINEIELELSAFAPRQNPLFYQLFYLTEHYKVEELFGRYVKTVASDKREFLLFEEPIFMPNIEQAPHLGQQTHLYKLLVSEKPLYHFHTLKHTHEGMFCDRDYEQVPYRSLQDSAQADIRAWTKTFKLKCLRQLGEIGYRNLVLANGLLEIPKHPTFYGEVSFASSSSHMRGPITDYLIVKHLKELGLKPIDFAPSMQTQETLLEIHHMESMNSLQKHPLELILDVNLAQGEVLHALSMDTSQNIISLGQGTPLAKGKVQFLFHELPENPHDGRPIPGKSLKLSFVKAKKGQKIFP